MIDNDLLLWPWIIGTAIPLLVALVTKSSASSAVKAVINALLSAGAGALAVALAQDDFNARALVFAIGTAWVTSVATYFGLYKPAGIALVVASIAPTTGLG